MPGWRQDCDPSPVKMPEAKPMSLPRPGDLLPRVRPNGLLQMWSAWSLRARSRGDAFAPFVDRLPDTRRPSGAYDHWGSITFLRRATSPAPTVPVLSERGQAGA